MINRRAVSYSGYDLVGSVIREEGGMVTMVITEQKDTRTGQPVEHPYLVCATLVFATRTTLPLK